MAKPSPLAVAFREVRHFQPDDCLHIEPIAVRARQLGWTIPAHRHDGLHQFQWLATGQVEVALDGHVSALAAPAALMLAPGTVHGFVYSRDSVGQQVTVPTHVLAQGLAHAPGLGDRLHASLLLGAAPHADGFDALAALFGDIADEFERDAPGRIEALQAQALLLALWFLRRAPAERPRDRRLALRDTLVQRFHALAERHFREQRPVSFYAAELGVTADHLSRACRAVSGLGALDLLHERVLREARRMLVYSERPVAEIGQQLGFDDAHYFSRFFARRAGLAPTAYRLRTAEGMSVGPDNG